MSEQTPKCWRDLNEMFVLGLTLSEVVWLNGLEPINLLRMYKMDEGLVVEFIKEVKQALHLRYTETSVLDISVRFALVEESIWPSINWEKFTSLKGAFDKQKSELRQRGCKETAIISFLSHMNGADETLIKNKDGLIKEIDDKYPTSGANLKACMHAFLELRQKMSELIIEGICSKLQEIIPKFQELTIPKSLDYAPGTVRIILLGITNQGKTTLTNALTGSTLQTSAMGRCTLGVKSHMGSWVSQEGMRYKIEILDTQGVLDSSERDARLKNDLKKAASDMVDVSALIMLGNARSPEVNDAFLSQATMYQSIFGDDISDNFAVVFTRFSAEMLKTEPNFCDDHARELRKKFLDDGQLRLNQVFFLDSLPNPLSLEDMKDSFSRFDDLIKWCASRRKTMTKETRKEVAERRKLTSNRLKYELSDWMRDEMQVKSCSLSSNRVDLVRASERMWVDVVHGALLFHSNKISAKTIVLDIKEQSEHEGVKFLMERLGKLQGKNTSLEVIFSFLRENYSFYITNVKFVENPSKNLWDEQTQNITVSLLITKKEIILPATNMKEYSEIPKIRKKISLTESWFGDLFGFEENAANTKERFLINPSDPTRMKSRANGEEFVIGKFEILKLYALNKRIEEIKGDGRLVVKHIAVRDMMELMADAKNSKAVFQIAGDYHNLQTVGGRIEEGITPYATSILPSHACAIATAPATVYRLYLHDHGDRVGENSNSFSNNLQDLASLLQNETESILKFENSRIIPGNNVNRLDHAIKSFDDSVCMNSIRVGVHRDVQVVFSARGGTTYSPQFTPIQSSTQFVHLVTCFALDCNTIPDPSWIKLAQMILDAQYEATLAATIMACSQSRIKRVFLTLVGHSMQKNKLAWILSAIHRACTTFKNHNIEVNIVHIDQVDKLIESYFKDFA